VLGGGSTLGLAEEDCDVGSNQSCQSILEIVPRFRSVCVCVCVGESRTIPAWVTIRSFQNVDLGAKHAWGSAWCEALTQHSSSLPSLRPLR